MAPMTSMKAMASSFFNWAFRQEREVMPKSSAKASYGRGIPHPSADLRSKPDQERWSGALDSHPHQQAHQSLWLGERPEQEGAQRDVGDAVADARGEGDVEVRRWQRLSVLHVLEEPHEDQHEDDHVEHAVADGREKPEEHQHARHPHVAVDAHGDSPAIKRLHGDEVDQVEEKPVLGGHEEHGHVEHEPEDER